jgi:replicative DNA helicase
MLIDKSAAAIACEILEPQEFYRAPHQTIFEALRTVSSNGKPLDLITVTDELRGRDKLAEVGGASYVHQLIDSVPSSARVEHYAGIVHELWLRRRLYDGAKTVLDALGGATMQAQDAASALQSLIVESALDTAAREIIPLDRLHAEGMENLAERAEWAKKHPGEIRGCSFGIQLLDRATDGMPPTSLTIISAPSSHGKTTLAVQVGLGNARRGKVVLFFSIEMSASQLYQRIVAHEGKVGLLKLRHGNLSAKDWLGIDRVSEITDIPFALCDDARLTVHQIAAKARAWQLQHGLDLIVVDYIQRVSPDKANSQNREREVSGIVEGLAAIAKMLNVAVIGLSQLNEQGQVRESRTIYHVCDLLLRIQEARDRPVAPDAKLRPVEISIDKARQGPAGIYVPLTWHRPHCRFAEEVPDR